MTGHRGKLRETLDLLRRQLDAADGIDAGVAERLRAAAGEVQDALESEEKPVADQPSLSERLTESATHFEQSHSTLAGTLHRLVDILGQMGI